MGNTQEWISAFRLRTLPLSFSCIGMGAFLAAWRDSFDGMTLALCLLTTLFLQVLSNLANDYGDSKHGADSDTRQGPSRAVQRGAISLHAMKKAIIITAILSFICGFGLIIYVFHNDLLLLFTFLGIGISSIVAAVLYTNGKKPYGYAGLGDISVFAFFGLVGVFGTYFLFTQSLDWDVILPAATCGIFSVAVLNINNIRDIQSDVEAGKKSIPVRIGRANAVLYHGLLLTSGFILALIFVIHQYQSYWQFLFFLVIPFLIKNGRAVARHQDALALDPYLKQMSLSTLIFVILFGIGLLIS